MKFSNFSKQKQVFNYLFLVNLRPDDTFELLEEITGLATCCRSDLDIASHSTQDLWLISQGLWPSGWHH